MQNLFPVEYEPEHGTQIGLASRGTTADDTIWFEVESDVVLHAANAYECEDGKGVVHG